MKKFFAKRARIVRDNYAGYEVQVWRWWFPFWLQAWNTGPTNTHSTIERAELFAKNCLQKEVIKEFVE